MSDWLILMETSFIYGQSMHWKVNQTLVDLKDRLGKLLINKEMWHKNKCRASVNFNMWWQPKGGNGTNKLSHKSIRPLVATIQDIIFPQISSTLLELQVCQVLVASIVKFLSKKSFQKSWSIEAQVLSLKCLSLVHKKCVSA